MRLRRWLTCLSLVAVAACQTEGPVTVAPKPANTLSASATLVPTIQFTKVATGIGNSGNLQVILLGATDGRPYLLYQVSGSGSWYWYGQLPNPNGLQFRAVSTGKASNGNLQVILLGKFDGRPYLIWQSNSNGAWHWYGQLPNPNGVGFSTVATDDSNVTVFGVGASDGLPYRIDLAGTSWYWFGQLPDPDGVHFSAVATTHCNPITCSLTELIGLGASDGLPYRITQLLNGTWSWSGQLPDPGIGFRAIATGIGGPNENPQLIGLRASDGLPYLIYQVNQNGQWYWFGQLPDPIGAGFSAVATGKGNNGNLQVILLRNGDGLPYLIYQVNGSGSWYWSGQLPDPSGVGFSAVAAGRGNNGNLQVILLGANDGLAYLIYQVSGSGNWYWGGLLPTP